MNDNCTVSEIRLKYRPKPTSTVIRDSSDLNMVLKQQVYDSDTIGYKESFKVLLLNHSNMLLGYATVSEGGLTSTMVDVRVVLQTALLSNATSIILSHNHPSGALRPSPQDDALTNKIKSACALLDIRVLDHIIVTPFDGYYSYCDNGRL